MENLASACDRCNSIFFIQFFCQVYGNINHQFNPRMVHLSSGVPNRKILEFIRPEREFNYDLEIKMSRNRIGMSRRKWGRRAARFQDALTKYKFDVEIAFFIVHPCK